MHVELGDLADWLAAIGAFTAAGIALCIATRDRKDRAAERHEAQKIAARLVHVDVRQIPKPALDVKVRNYGPLPALDVAIIDATWNEHPDARWTILQANWTTVDRVPTPVRKPVLMPAEDVNDTYDTTAEYRIGFIDPSTNEMIKTAIDPRTANFPLPNYQPIDRANTTVTVAFTTADGVRWAITTNGTDANEPVRLTPPAAHRHRILRGLFRRPT